MKLEILLIRQNKTLAKYTCYTVYSRTVGGGGIISGNVFIIIIYFWKRSFLSGWEITLWTSPTSTSETSSCCLLSTPPAPSVSPKWPNLGIHSNFTLGFILISLSETWRLAFISDTIRSSTPRYLTKPLSEAPYQTLSLDQQKPSTGLCRTMKIADKQWPPFITASIQLGRNNNNNIPMKQGWSHRSSCWTVAPREPEMIYTSTSCSATKISRRVQVCEDYWRTELLATVMQCSVFGWGVEPPTSTFQTHYFS